LSSLHYDDVNDGNNDDDDSTKNAPFYHFWTPVSRLLALHRHHHKQYSPQDDCSSESVQVVALQSAYNKLIASSLTALCNQKACDSFFLIRNKLALPM